jgi:hypothetical protein
LKTCLDQTSPVISRPVQSYTVLFNPVQSVVSTYPIQCDPGRFCPLWSSQSNHEQSRPVLSLMSSSDLFRLAMSGPVQICPALSSERAPPVSHPWCRGE